MNSWEGLREIVQRIVIWGDLELLSPAHFGTGEKGDLTDMDIARDAYDGSAVLTGTSIAGALRAALLQHEQGYRPQEVRYGAAERLFGGNKGDDDGGQSPLIVDDAYASITQTLVRDGVKLEAATRTAADKKKYDIELLPRGTVFLLRFELLLSATDKQEQQLAALATVLTLLQQGQVRLGARKTRGLGRCIAKNWRVQTYQLTAPQGLIAWLRHTDHDHEQIAPINDIRAALGVADDQLVQDKRQRVTMRFDAVIDGAMLVRGAAPLGEGRTPDSAMFSEQNIQLIPGSSIAGALRARAQRIATLVPKASGLIEQIFGSSEIKKLETGKASRLIVDDAILVQSQPLVQSRVAIDRFTGGALETALFAEQPAIGGTTTINLELRCDQRLSIEQATGLLLLLLKDLWTGDLPLGGTISIGRGRLAGRKAVLSMPDKSFILTDEAGFGLSQAQRDALEYYVQALSVGGA